MSGAPSPPPSAPHAGPSGGTVTPSPPAPSPPAPPPEVPAPVPTRPSGAVTRTRDAEPGSGQRLAIEPPYRPPPIRALLGALALFVLVGGVLYPLAVDGFARGTGGFDSLGVWVPGGDPARLADNAIGQNITDPALFWMRPSLNDYNWTVTSTSGESPPGPTDPALLNLTEYYIGLYGLNDTTAPLQLVSDSESGLDPDLDPAGALIQIPRVSLHSNLTEAFLTAFVEAHVQEPVLGLFGAPYVNVIQLDKLLLPMLSASPG